MGDETTDGLLAGRTALVTGGGRGVGRGIALGLARAGATVAVNYQRGAEAAEATVRDILDAGGRAHAYQASVGVWGETQAMVEAITADTGPIDILVNNAGIASRGLPVAETDPSEVERVVRTHAFGSFQLSKLVIPGMRTRPRGDIIMISSTTIQHMAPNGVPYHMAKAAMEALAKGLVHEVRGDGIRVNIVAPGLVATDMGGRLARAMHGVDDIHALDEDSPFGHVCTPEDVAGVVVSLCTTPFGYVTGQRISVDGGGPTPSMVG